MKKIIIFSLILVVLMITGCTQDRNRYELYDPNTLLDKQTGAVWKYNYYTDEWRYIGTPPKDATKRTIRPKKDPFEGISQKRR